MKTIQEVAEWCRDWFIRKNDPFWTPYEPIIEIQDHYLIWFVGKDGLEEYCSRTIPFKFLLQLHQKLNDGLNFNIVTDKNNSGWGLVFDYKRFAPDEMWK